ncbi:uncharacterized protein LOC111918216 [Lactuca sativa]|uniref:Zinc-finger domain-containing protein n=1 Tax=Lactuca sativa TaxID=4236 RepID=A0A9R1UIG3_LACSA|nr:uncharacterized protein LOC111918216 [Lactuca sativa]KAJ0187508.1 hypothetical protein LSAT_V11C900499990 [Lactuca sativa]
MVSKKKRRHGNGGIEPEKENDGGGVADYELSREQRIKANLERMQKLGILELSRNLKPPPKPKTIRPPKRLPPSPTSQRRSSRIQTLPTVDYSEMRVPNSNQKVIKDVKIEIKEGSQPEVYTEEHEKALGDHKETWTLCVDGYDDEGNRMYDAYAGKSCHQCRQKTTGHRTKCCKCNTVQGQFCGDCLFMRYGENVLEAKENPEWVCPVCRDICNCSRCRRVKGWEPTGNLYRKVLRLGFKSVAHYLIHTRGPNGKQEDMEDLKTSDEEGDEVDDRKNVSSVKNINDHDGGDGDSDYKSDDDDDDDDNDNDDDDNEGEDDD